MKFLKVSFICFLISGIGFSQSKKETIVILNTRIDSLKRNITSERNSYLKNQFNQVELNKKIENLKSFKNISLNLLETEKQRFLKELNLKKDKISFLREELSTINSFDKKSRYQSEQISTQNSATETQAFSGNSNNNNTENNSTNTTTSTSPSKNPFGTGGSGGGKGGGKVGSGFGNDNRTGDGGAGGGSGRETLYNHNKHKVDNFNNFQTIKKENFTTEQKKSKKETIKLLKNLVEA